MRMGVVSFGASQFDYETQRSNPRFKKSAVELAAILTDPRFVGEKEIVVCDLYDSPASASDIGSSIAEFVIDERLDEVVIHYCGHGVLSSMANKRFCAYLRSTKERHLNLTTLEFSKLMSDLEPHLEGINVFAIIDACYSGAAVSEFMEADVSRLITQQLAGSFEKKGRAVIVASDAEEIALAKTEDDMTLLTGTLVRTIREGISELASPTLSWGDVFRKSRDAMTERLGTNAPNAKLVDAKGSFGDRPFFRNATFKLIAPVTPAPEFKAPPPGPLLSVPHSETPLGLPTANAPIKSEVENLPEDIQPTYSPTNQPNQQFLNSLLDGSQPELFAQSTGPRLPSSEHSQANVEQSDPAECGEIPFRTRFLSDSPEPEHHAWVHHLDGPDVSTNSRNDEKPVGASNVTKQEANGNITDYSGHAEDPSIGDRILRSVFENLGTPAAHHTGRRHSFPDGTEAEVVIFPTSSRTFEHMHVKVPEYNSREDETQRKDVSGRTAQDAADLRRTYRPKPNYRRGRRLHYLKADIRSAIEKYGHSVSVAVSICLIAVLVGIGGYAFYYLLTK